MPGAALDSVDGDDFTGRVKVKLGPINLTYQGKASFIEKDEAAHKAVIDARGKDQRGNGTAAAVVTAKLAAEGSITRVDVLTDLNITGRPAQFGRGVMTDVGNKLLGQFADKLAAQLGEGDAQGDADRAAAAGGSAAKKTAAKAAATASGAVEEVAASAEQAAGNGAGGQAVKKAPRAPRRPPRRRPTRSAARRSRRRPPRQEGRVGQEDGGRQDGPYQGRPVAGGHRVRRGRHLRRRHRAGGEGAQRPSRWAHRPTEPARHGRPRAQRAVRRASHRHQAAGGARADRSARGGRWGRDGALRRACRRHRRCRAGHRAARPAAAPPLTPAAELRAPRVLRTRGHQRLMATTS
ncbi:SRPBCC family protein [Blastococcus brunescens]|uniref:SRPBCC family protein n=1 Tax=Blastococcus brunescens TaxID=1564165 RepID=A0ABZ1AYC3_9ACTN|nr:SRPBCC family protein [Blastococcus sp. BMG 8361]WRL63515.1 SRPBCC family protein [Blastococcus sp. BMG 8361]